MVVKICFALPVIKNAPWSTVAKRESARTAKAMRSIAQIVKVNLALEMLVVLKNKYKIFGDTTVIYINYKNKTYECLIDTSDLELVSKYSLRLTTTGYARYTKRINGKPTSVLLHRVLAKTPKNVMVDHVNHNRLDNRKSNLRNVDNSINQLNRQGVSGVVFNRVNKYKIWTARIQVNGKRVFLGNYYNQKDAENIVRMYRENVLSQYR